MKTVKLAALLALLICSAAAAQENADKTDFIAGVDSIDFIYARGYAGFDGIKIIPGADSKVLFYLGAGYLTDSYLRDLAGETRYDSSFEFANSKFNTIAVDARLGLDLGLLYKPELKKNWLYSRFYVMSEFQHFIQDNAEPSVLSQTTIADRDGFWVTSLFWSLQLDLLEADHKDETVKGISAEAAVEWVPGLGINSISGDADFVRLHTNFIGFMPLVKKQFLGLYIGERFMFDCLLGDKISSYAQRRIGGFKKSNASGGAVRGIAKNRFDGYLKLVNNIDIRLTFPGLIAEKIIPEVFAFFDMALVDDLDYKLCSIEDGLYTGGIGLFVNSNLGGIALDAGWYVSYNFQEDHFNPFNIKMGVHQF